MSDILKELKGDDLRSIGKANKVVLKINTQTQFDELLKGLFSENRNLEMRVIDVIEKVTLNHPEFLNSAKTEIFNKLYDTIHKEIKWHLALVLPRLKLTHSELLEVWEKLSYWAIDKKESRIVRVNSLQGMFQLCKHNDELKSDLKTIFLEIERENIPSLNARIKKLRILF